MIRRRRGKELVEDIADERVVRMIAKPVGGARGSDAMDKPVACAPGSKRQFVHTFTSFKSKERRHEFIRSLGFGFPFLHDTGVFS
jgi:hypothetical protein